MTHAGPHLSCVSPWTFAGAAAGGGSASSGGANNEEEGGEFDEPPEIQQFIQEIGQSMGPLGGLGAGGSPT